MLPLHYSYRARDKCRLFFFTISVGISMPVALAQETPAPTSPLQPGQWAMSSLSSLSLLLPAATDELFEGKLEETLLAVDDGPVAYRRDREGDLCCT